MPEKTPASQRVNQLITPVLRPAWQIARSIRQYSQYRFHSARMKQRLKPANANYQRYVDSQLRRTLIKDDGVLLKRQEILIGKVVAHVDPIRSRVLCIGCRNTAELDYFHAKGVESVVGIDLFSQRSDILVMDMHAMTFEANSFDVVYSSHSLEHALEPERAISEFVRVAKPGGLITIEVPVRFETGGADLVDFKSLDCLLTKFTPHVAEVLWAEHRPAGVEDGSGTEVIRTIFRVSK